MPLIVEAVSPVALAAREGLSGSPKSLPPWLFYDEAGSQLFEQITVLPEYYLTRTERGILKAHAGEILRGVGGPVTVVELGAGTATKTGLLLAAAAEMQGTVEYQPIDVSATALEEAQAWIEARDSGGAGDARGGELHHGRDTDRTDAGDAGAGAVYRVQYWEFFAGGRAGEFCGTCGSSWSQGMRCCWERIWLRGPNKSVGRLRAAYDDAQGVTAAFNKNILARLNKEMGARFSLDCFRHSARWNEGQSRMEMHLESMVDQVVTVPGVGRIEFKAGETIHTENSYKFDAARLDGLLVPAGFAAERSFMDAEELFAVTLAVAV